MTQYILFSPAHETKIPGFEKPNGEVVPERIVHCRARGLYRHKRLTDRRYRREIPDFDPELKLLTCKTITAAIREQKALEAYSGERFEIRAYNKGEIGEQAL
ncbi:MAG: hypothetical protein IJP78_07770 [Clostridia bacterium]|nr:hypothetical protein [Clostridia bacterium]